jgi:hypothetical protein
LLAGAFALACGSITTDLNEVIALQITLPDSGRMDFGDTLFATAEALNGRGDSVGALVTWADLDTIVHVDSLTGAVTARVTGTGLIQARTGSLRSNPQAITVFPRADTTFAESTTPNPDTVHVKTPTDAGDTAFVYDSLSDALGVHVQNLGTGSPMGLAGRIVTFSLVYPPDTIGFALRPFVTTTDLNGLAVAQVKLKNRTLPDSAVVRVTVTRFNGVAVHGSPITFVVRFTP